jgi:hypothetical protein
LARRSGHSGACSVIAMQYSRGRGFVEMEGARSISVRSPVYGVMMLGGNSPCRTCGGRRFLLWTCCASSAGPAVLSSIFIAYADE